MKEIAYIGHTCRKKKCKRAFVAVDLYNSLNYPPTYRYCPSCVENGFKNLKFFRFTVPESLREKEFNKINIDYFILLINEKLQSEPELKLFASKLLKQSIIYLERDILKNKRISKKNHDSCFNMAVEKINYFKNPSSKTLLQAG